MEFKHTPILANKIIELLEIKKNGIYLDCTVGGAGHSFLIAQKLNNTGRLICLDKDDDALAVSRERLKQFNNVTFCKTDFKNADVVLEELGINKIDGVLIDLGVSSYQLDEKDRGFSFLHDGELDMRMDRTQELSAKTVVNCYSKEKLVNILRDYGEEEFANVIANNIIASRPIETTKQLADIVEKSIPKKIIFKRGGAHKKAFQAIRIEVNGELDGLDNIIKNLIKKLNVCGRMAILTFHSLEDRIVKQTYKEFATGCICPPKTPICICGHKAEIKLVTKKPIVADEEEKMKNSRSTCAKLRVAEKI